MSKQSNPFDARHRACAIFTARGKSNVWISEHLGVNISTVERWRARPDVQAEIERTRERMAATDWLTVTLDALLSAMKNDGIDWNARLRAAALLQQSELGNPPPPEEHAHSEATPAPRF